MTADWRSWMTTIKSVSKRFMKSSEYGQHVSSHLKNYYFKKLSCCLNLFMWLLCLTLVKAPMKKLVNWLTPGNRNWINQDILCGSKANGGLNFIDAHTFFMSLKVSWIKRYTTNRFDYHCAVCRSHWWKAETQIECKSPNSYMGLWSRNMHDQLILPMHKSLLPCMAWFQNL